MKNTIVSSPLRTQRWLFKYPKNFFRHPQANTGSDINITREYINTSYIILQENTSSPTIEYCCQLWNPWKAKDIQAIKAIRQTFTYKITEVLHINYWERLQELKLYSLQRRCKRYIIIYIWKITQHMVPNMKYWWHNVAQNKKPENTENMDLSALFSIQQTETQHNPFKKIQ